ncbi:MAG: ABC transporter ATP-binding protein, partial [Ruminococcus sp.]|nr:ABC transporter ATP-binding protein [Ruminococcus sp.]
MNIIEVEHLVKNYKDVEAVRDISFAVEEGSFFAFLGVNGAGKSTTINILCTVLDKTSGKVTIGGYDLDSEREKIKSLIGIVFQNSVLDKQLTVRENLTSRASYYGLSKSEIKERLSELSDTFDLSDVMNRRYASLSGGQRRRVDIARALINRPKLLFLDEPTTGLDPMTRRKVWEVIHELRRDTGLTVFLTTHYMEETVNCDHVVILDNGSVAAEGTPHQLKEQYAGNRLVWYTERTDRTDALLTDKGLDFSYSIDSYKISLSDTESAKKLIGEIDSITDFEFIKGNMDDVFLT